MKVIIFVALCIAVSSCSTIEEPVLILERPCLVEGFIEGELSSKVGFQYDSLGRLSMELLGGDGPFDRSIAYIYHSDGTIKELQYDHDLDGEIDSITYRHYRYDDLGRLVESFASNEDGLAYAHKYYDYIDGLDLVSVEEEVSGEQVIVRYEKTYDDQERLIKEERDGGYGSGDFVDGTIDQTIYFTYDDKNNLVKKEMEGSLETGPVLMIDCIEYQYDQGLLVETIKKSENKVVDMIIYTYDKNGRLLRAEGDGQHPSDLTQLDGIIDWHKEYSYSCE